MHRENDHTPKKPHAVNRRLFGNAHDTPKKAVTAGKAAEKNLGNREIEKAVTAGKAAEKNLGSIEDGLTELQRLLRSPSSKPTKK